MANKSDSAVAVQLVHRLIQSDWRMKGAVRTVLIAWRSMWKMSVRISAIIKTTKIATNKSVTALNNVLCQELVGK